MFQTQSGDKPPTTKPTIADDKIMNEIQPSSGSSGGLFGEVTFKKLLFGGLAIIAVMWVWNNAGSLLVHGDMVLFLIYWAAQIAFAIFVIEFIHRVYKALGKYINS